MSTPPAEENQALGATIVDDSDFVEDDDGVTASDPDDPRLHKTIGLVRQMSLSNLKEQCVRTEWAAVTADLERELLLEVVVDQEFWDEVKNMADAEMDTMPNDEDDNVDTRERLLQMFKCFDKDNSGTIDSNELHQMLLYMGISATDKEVKDMIAQVDKNGDGDIDEEEFLIVMQQAQSGTLAMPPPTDKAIRTASINAQENAQAAQQ